MTLAGKAGLISDLTDWDVRLALRSGHVQYPEMADEIADGATMPGPEAPAEMRGMKIEGSGNLAQKPRLIISVAKHLLGAPNPAGLADAVRERSVPPEGPKRGEERSR